MPNVPYYFATRPIFQTRSRFWTRENLTASMEFNVPELNHVWAASEEVETPRGLIVGTATGPQTPERALAAYRRLYPGKLVDVEKAHAVVWATIPGRRRAKRPSTRQASSRDSGRPSSSRTAASTSSARTPTT